MSKPIIPKFMADTVVLETINVQYNQTWDGAAWVIDPNNVELICFGQLAETGTSVITADIKMYAVDLPPAGVTALQELLNYIELEMVAKYE